MPAPVARPNPLDQALRYLALGFSVIPVKARDKRPALASWKEFQQRRPSAEEIRGWFDGHADLNIAIVTGAVSGFVVVDADSDEAVIWMQAHHQSPIRSRTAKGAHFLFAHPGHEVRNNAKLGGMALDIRGDGGYIVAPGSVHPSGHIYQEEGDWDHLESMPLFQASWLGEKVQPLVKPADALEKRVRAYMDRIPGEAKGSRDNTAFRVACKLVREFALTEDSALGYLAEWNTKNAPPLPLSDLKVKIASALKSGRAAMGSKLDSPGSSGHWTPPAQSDAGESVDVGGAGTLQELLTRTKDRNIRKTPGNLAKILRLDPQFGAHLALDEMTREVIFGGEVVGDTFVDWVQEQIEDHHGVAFGRDEVAAKILAQASLQTVHPVRDWLQTLTWDGVERIHRLALEVLGSPSAVATHYLRCTMVGAVRRVLYPGTKLDTIPVLEGPQGLGKSTFWRDLVGAHWFCDSPLDLDSKDGMMLIHRRWCTEIAELDHHTSTKAAERVKGFLSSTEDIFRPPFGRTVATFKRSCFMVGTTNREGFLVDPTGSRRFWPIKCLKIDLTLLNDWREQLWAEAMDLHHAGIPHWLDNSQEALREEESAQFEAQDPWDEQISIAASALCNAGRRLSDGFTITDLLTQMNLPVSQQNRAAEMRMALLLKKKGWTKERSLLSGLRAWRWKP